MEWCVNGGGDGGGGADDTDDDCYGSNSCSQLVENNRLEVVY